MSTPHIIIGILLFAAATAVLYAWGLSKSMRQQQDMTRNLLHACGSRVVKYLKKHDTITEKQIAKEIEGVRIGQFWSKKKLQVQDGKKGQRRGHQVPAGAAVYGERRKGRLSFEKIIRKKEFIHGSFRTLGAPGRIFVF